MTEGLSHKPWPLASYHLLGNGERVDHDGASMETRHGVRTFYFHWTEGEEKRSLVLVGRAEAAMMTGKLHGWKPDRVLRAGELGPMNDRMRLDQCGARGTYQRTHAGWSLMVDVFPVGKVPAVLRIAAVRAAQESHG